SGRSGSGESMLPLGSQCRAFALLRSASSTTGIMKPALPFALPAPASGHVDLLIIAGEHSGDQHAAAMLRDLRATQPTLEVCALGGPELRAAGAQLLHDLTASSVVGLV